MRRRIARVLVGGLVVAAAAPAWAASTERVRGQGGVQCNMSCEDPAISAGGRFVVFDSRSTNLVPRDTNGTRDVFVRTR